MNQQAFIDYVRQYARMAQRKHRSYADEVHTIAQARVNHIKKTVEDARQRAAAIQQVQGVLSNEYQPWDGEFAVRSYD